MITVPSFTGGYMYVLMCVYIYIVIPKVRPTKLSVWLQSIQNIILYPRKEPRRNLAVQTLFGPCLTSTPNGQCDVFQGAHKHLHSLYSLLFPTPSSQNKTPVHQNPKDLQKNMLRNMWFSGFSVNSGLMPTLFRRNPDV